MSETKLNIYQKITQITEAIGIIQKDSEAPQVMGGYKFTSHGSVIGHLRHELTSRNVVILPSGEELVRLEVTEKRTPTYQNGQIISEKISFSYHSAIKYKFTVIDGDNPIDRFEGYWFGEGIDTGDKGFQKAGTSAEKYYLMKLFKIGDKDDPDGISVEGEARTQSQSATMNKPGTPTPYVPPSSPNTTSAPATLTSQAMKSNGELEKLAVDAGLKPDPHQTELSPEELKNRLDALVWFGEQLPPTTGWFKGKVTALVGLWEAKNKTNTLTPEEKASGSGLQNVFNQIAEAHKVICGSDKCEHIIVPKLAFLYGGRITDPAK